MDRPPSQMLAGAPTHIFFHEREIRCHHCGAREVVLPVSLSEKRLKAFQITVEAFTEEHAECVAKPRGSAPMTPEEWLSGPDTGISSCVIYSVMTGTRLGRDWSSNVPHDPDDFGRCYRLLEIFPRWRPRLSEVAVAHPQWAPLVREWAQLEALYARGDYTDLYARMRVLLGKDAL